MNSGAKSVILLVEDDKFLRTLLADKLKREGLLVVVAENGQEALIKMKDQPRPHIVLLDLLLPVMDGFEVLRQMKADEDLRRMPVIVLSNLGQEEDIRKAKELGAKDYMVKAYFTPSEIIEKILVVMREVYV